ncbi:hypothetical protein L7F22_012150 [Adiantum nelumboides]|nr:hypothetical protein [Adiantum nelumboides]
MTDAQQQPEEPLPDEVLNATAEEIRTRTDCWRMTSSDQDLDSANDLSSLIGLVPPESLRPGDLIGVNKDSYLVLDKLPAEYDSRVKAMEVDERPTETYTDIGGLDKQIEELVEAIVLPMQQEQKFKNLGIKPPKGCLMYGPPGTGKTLLARACAAQTNACYLKLAGPSLVQMFIGDGAKLVRDAFELAKEKAPAIIFIDELDAIGTKRFDSDKSGDREVQRTMLELLNQLDGFSSDERIKVIAATNRIDILDPALLRSAGKLVKGLLGCIGRHDAKGVGEERDENRKEQRVGHDGKEDHQRRSKDGAKRLGRVEANVAIAKPDWALGAEHHERGRRKRGKETKAGEGREGSRRSALQLPRGFLSDRATHLEHNPDDPACRPFASVAEAPEGVEKAAEADGSQAHEKGKVGQHGLEGKQDDIVLNEDRGDAGTQENGAEGERVERQGCGKEKRGDDDDKRGKRKYGRGSDEGSRHLQRSKLEDAHDQDGSDDDQDDDGGNNSEDYGFAKRRSRWRCMGRHGTGRSKDEHVQDGD